MLCFPQLMLLAIPLNTHKHYISDGDETDYSHSLREFSQYLPGDYVDMIQLGSNFFSLILWDKEKLAYKRRLGESTARVFGTPLSW